jgi:hypothetical protein
MWAMIATCIGLAVWAGILTYFARKYNKTTAIEAEEQVRASELATEKMDEHT